MEAGRQGPFTVTPTIAVSEEYNDNIFLSNTNKQWDFLTALTPGVRVALQKQNYRLLGAVDFSGQLYAKNSSLDGINTRNFILDGLYRVDPRLSLTLTERYSFSQNTNTVSLQGVSTGRTASQSNNIAAVVSWQFDQRNTVRFTAGWAHETFSTSTTGSGLNSDTYRAEVATDHLLTPRLTGIVLYRFSYIDIQSEVPVTTHSPRLGATYRITPTLSATVNAGPEFEVVRGSTSVQAGASASLAKIFKWGGISAVYDRSVGSSGGLTGATENQSVSALVRWTTLARGLVLEVAPRYATVKSTSQTASTVDLQSFTITARATYQFNQWLTGFGTYTFFKQTTSGNSLGGDVDQNRLTFGIQFGYPIRFD